jgi:hypothetical protein
MPDSRVNDIIRMAHEALLMSAMDGCEWSAPIPGADYPDRLSEFAKLVAAAEREACAKVCEDLTLAHPGRADLTADQCAAAIRARGKE